MLLVVDGTDVCRAPMLGFVLQQRLAASGALGGTEVADRGLDTEAGRTMCENAATRLGFTGPAIAYFGSHRSSPLTQDDVRRADLVLTAERMHRSAAVRMLPGTQASVFTWREALVLASVLADRRRTGALSAPRSLADLARALHGVRGTVPLIEPPSRTGPFHWRRAMDADPLTIVSGHDGRAEHHRITQQTMEVAGALADRLDAVVGEHVPELRLAPAVRPRRVRRTA